MEAPDVAIGVGLDMLEHLGMSVLAEQVREALLRLEVLVATYGISCAIAISGRFLPLPNSAPGCEPTAIVVAVRAAGGVAELRCTPVFM
jgi:hypothetical protein